MLVFRLVFAATVCGHRRQCEHEMFPMFPSSPLSICHGEIFPISPLRQPHTRSNPRLSRSARAGPAASTHIWPRGAARPSGATPPAHATRRSLSAPTMRCASLWRPSGFAKSRPHNSCHLPFAGEAAAIGEPRDAAAAARSPLLHRANPPDCPHSFPARERRSPLACQSLRGSSPSAEDTRECAGRRDANAEACCP